LRFTFKAHLLYDLEDLAVVTLSDDELVHVLLALDVHWPEVLQIVLTNSLLPGTTKRFIIVRN